MTNLTLRNLTKKFDQFIAVDDVSIEITDGKFVCLLGPSGCGKTTLLRLIAGLEQETSGQVLVDGADQSIIPAHQRDFGMVFQSLALFPHLSVGDNIAYPLRVRGAQRKECEARVKELLELVELPDIQNRKIHQLSGGQRQRVAIARGLAINPKLFLLDEPLSALDAKLREHMQIELRQLQQSLGITTIVVTHDQREAMTMADMVIVMNQGRILQAASPIEIYQNPVNAFVADFIGMSNLIPCKRSSKNTIDILDYKVALSREQAIEIKVDETGTFSIRPEDVSIVADAAKSEICGEIKFIRDLGASVEISVDVRGFEILSVSSPKDRPNIKIGQTVGIQFNSERATVMAS